MSRSKSSSASSNSTTDARVAGDNGAIGISSQGGEVQVHVTADEAFDLAEVAIENMLALSGRAIGIGEKGQETVAAALTTTQQNQKSEAGQLSEQLVKIGIPAVVIGIIVTGVFSK